MNVPKHLQQLVGLRVRIVADDMRGYGVQTKYVGQHGHIVSWRPWKYGRFLPVIELDSGEVLSSSKIWWGRVKRE